MIKFFITQVNGCWIIVFPTEEVFMYGDEPQKVSFIRTFTQVVARYAEHFHDGDYFKTVKNNHHEAWFTCLPQFDKQEFITWLKMTMCYFEGVAIGVDIVDLEN